MDTRYLSLIGTYIFPSTRLSLFGASSVGVQSHSTAGDSLEGARVFYLNQ
jgi:hypothetical protein